MRPADTLKLSNGIECITIDERDRVIVVIVPEGWRVQVMPTDSGQVAESAALPNWPGGVMVTPRRVAAAPTLERNGERFYK